MQKSFVFCCIIFCVFSTYSWISASANIINIVAIGDSITYGSGDEEKKGYVKRLEEQIEKQTGQSVFIENFGVPKYTTTDVLAQLKERKVKKSIRRAHHIILFIGTNDYRKSVDYTFSPLKTAKLELEMKRYSNHLQQILSEIRRENKHASIFVLGLFQPYVEYENSNQIRNSIEQWNKEIMKIVSKNDNSYYVQTIDLFPAKSKKVFFTDTLHPNGKGYMLLSNRIYEIFASASR